MATFIYLLLIIVYLFVMDNKQCLFGNHGHQTWPLFSSHHRHLFLPPPPTMLVTAATPVSVTFIYKSWILVQKASYIRMGSCPPGSLPKM